MAILKAKMNTQDVAVAEYLTTLGVIFNTSYVCETMKEGWQCDQWHITFKNSKAEYSVDFFTGLGHRMAAIKMPADIARLATNIIARMGWEKQHVKPASPTAASVLYGLLLDAASAEQNFLDWCDEYGYDSDSRKALSVYEACCETRRKMAQVFSKAEQSHLQTLLEDY